jgi:hypothetical protein
MADEVNHANSAANNNIILPDGTMYNLQSLLYKSSSCGGKSSTLSFVKGGVALTLPSQRSVTKEKFVFWGGVFVNQGC